MDEKKSKWGNCTSCKIYGFLNEEGICKTCILYPKPNTGEKQAEWRISKMKKSKEEEDEKLSEF